MESMLSWERVVDVEDQLVEFVACHEFMALRRHMGGVGRFRSLKNAITSTANGARTLLQRPGGNNNHKNYQERGDANHVAVWYENSYWAILMNKEQATLVPKTAILAIANGNTHTSPAKMRAMLVQLFEESPMGLRRALDGNFYKTTIAYNT